MDDKQYGFICKSALAHSEVDGYGVVEENR